MQNDSTQGAALVPIADIERMALAVAKSGLFGIKTPDQAAALMLVAQAEGRHPGIVARDYHIIQGRPTLKADAILARFQEAGGTVEWSEYTDTRVEGTFSHPSGGKLTLAWSIEDAKRAGLANSATWKQYPRAMLRARVISEGIRTVFPGVLAGVYTPEEVADFGAKPPPERNMGPVKRADEPTPKRETITEAQHRRLEALIREHGLPRERVKQAVARYLGKHGEHLSKLRTDHAKWVEGQLPKWADAYRKEQERAAQQAGSALDWAVNEGGWDGSLEGLEPIIKDLEQRAKSERTAARMKDRGGDDQEQLANADALAQRAAGLRFHLERHSQEVAQ